jgi:xanthine dehydrogenase YagT iron-sulfur-binding subunit
MTDLRLRVNGAKVSLSVDARMSLLDLLRESLGLTGPKRGCDYGQYEACTVLIDIRRARACLALAVAQDGADIVTVEGLANGGRLHPLQSAFIERDAF